MGLGWIRGGFGWVKGLGELVGMEIMEFKVILEVVFRY